MTMIEKLREAIASVADIKDPAMVELSYPEETFGDYATNVALKIAKEKGVNPRDLAVKLSSDLKAVLGDLIDSVEVAGPGFINIRLSVAALVKASQTQPAQTLSNQVVVIEFSDPNPFKTLHAGHLYTSLVGDSMANLLSAAGAQVYRVNYGGDVGLHAAKALWSIVQSLGGVNPDKLDTIDPKHRGEWVAQAYVRGTEAYDSDESAKASIQAINKQIYAIQSTQDKTSPLSRIYWTTRQWSYDEFKDFYARINVKFDRFYPESEATPIGLAKVEEQLERGVFEKSDGAVVFRGDNYGLHTRVFINSQGLPTYEAKELGLFELKQRDYHADKSIILTGSEQEQYMAVVLKALEQFEPALAASTTHLTHGLVRLSGGKKMSSRKGSILKATDVLDIASAAAQEVSGNVDNRVVLAAVKYAMLKQRLGGDIIFEPKESVSVLGNSGPYIQYAHARARSILAKSSNPPMTNLKDLTADERSLVLKLSRYSEVVNQAITELSPHLMCTYLYDTTQAFNRFYESNRVIGDDREAVRLGLVTLYADRLRDGLQLLGIDAPNHL